MDIKEIAKKMTRKEFLNTYGGYCPSKFELENSENCEDEKWSCYNCLKEATKDIKFKDDTEKPLVKVGVVEFYENGIVKFPKNNNKTWMQQAMEHVEPVIREELKKAISKEHEVISEYEEGYRINNDTGTYSDYPKELFEKVEDVLMVECINNGGFELILKLNEKYHVKEEVKERYILEEIGAIYEFNKDRFKLVEQQKETKSYMINDTGKEVRVDKGKVVKEYSVIELLDFPVGTKFKHEDGTVKIVDFEQDNKGILLVDIDRELILSSKWASTKFTLVEELKSVSTTETKKEIICYRKECSSNKDNKCTNKLMNIGSSLVGCPIRLKEPINYEEENKKCYQESEKCPKNEKGKCTDSKICGNQYPAGFDFELECFRLQKENEELRKEDLNKEIRLNNQSKRISTDGNQIQKLFQEIEKQKADNEKLRQANATNLDEYEEHLKILKEELEKARAENEELKEANISLGDMRKELISKTEELERENLGLKDKLETIDDEYQEELRELKESNNSFRILSEKYSEKYNKEKEDNKRLRESVKSLASVL